MNYKLVNEKWTKFQERSGLIENNSTGEIEIVITNGEEYPQSKNAKILCSNGKMLFSLKKSQSIYGLSSNRIYGMINILPLEDLDMGGVQDLEAIKKELDKKVNISDIMTEEQAEMILNKYKESR